MLRQVWPLYLLFAILEPFQAFVLTANHVLRRPLAYYCLTPSPVVRSDAWQSTGVRVAYQGAALKSRRLEDQIDENSRKRVEGGIGETAAGAILGGLLLGPFGALFGASLGSNIGAKNALEKARKEEMDRLGITQDMLDMAKEVGLSLERSAEGLQATRDSLETQQRFARRLDGEAARLYERAKVAVSENNEELAKKLLLDRQRDLDKLKEVLRNCADEKKRLLTMESNVAALERRAMEVEALLCRTMGAKSLVDTSGGFGLSLPTDDPLLQKFRDMGID